MGNFTNNLRRSMALSNMNQLQLAKASGVSQSLISLYLSDNPKANAPQLKNLLALSDALKCTLEELTGIERREKTNDNRSKLTEHAIELAMFYESLPDDDPRLKIIESFLEWDKREKKAAAKENEENSK